MYFKSSPDPAAAMCLRPQGCSSGLNLDILPPSTEGNLSSPLAPRLCCKAALGGICGSPQTDGGREEREGEETDSQDLDEPWEKRALVEETQMSQDIPL